jgi:Zn ribbon nucleic-acid-binding protein
MKEQLINCPRCNSNACSEMSDDKIIIWQCLGCGFTSNTFLNEENSVKYKEVLPELYKDLEFIDEKGLRWYPTSVVMEDKSMIFADGGNKDEWKWAAVQSKEGKADMETIKHFEEKEFIEALDYIDFFTKQK